MRRQLVLPLPGYSPNRRRNRPRPRAPHFPSGSGVLRHAGLGDRSRRGRKSGRRPRGAVIRDGRAREARGRHVQRRWQPCRHHLCVGPARASRPVGREVCPRDRARSPVDCQDQTATAKTTRWSSSPTLPLCSSASACSSPTRGSTSRLRRRVAGGWGAPAICREADIVFALALFLRLKGIEAGSAGDCLKPHLAKLLRRALRDLPPTDRHVAESQAALTAARA